MKKILLFVCIMLFIKANAQKELQSKVFVDYNGATQAYFAMETQDGNLIIAGEKDDGSLLMKINLSGNYMWKKKIGGSYSRFTKTLELDDMSIIAIGSQGGTSIVKTNNQGEVIWAKSIPSVGNQWNYSIDTTIDDGFYVCSNISNTSIYVAKLDEQGSTIWSKKYEAGNNSNTAYSIKTTIDGGCIVSGFIEDYPPFDAGACLLKLDANGTIQWSKKYNHPYANYSCASDILIREESFFVILSYEYGVALMKTDVEGNIVWGKDIECNNTVNSIKHIKETKDNGFLLTYSIGPYYPSPSGLMKFDSAANLVYIRDLMMEVTDVAELEDGITRVIGNGPLYGVKKITYEPQVGLTEIDSSGNGGECIVGVGSIPEEVTITSEDIAFTINTSAQTQNINIESIDTYLSSRDGCVDVTGAIEEQHIENCFATYDCTKGTLIIRNIISNRFKLNIYSTTGQIIFEKTLVNDNQEITLPKINSGIYIIRIESNGEIYSQKMIIF